MSFFFFVIRFKPNCILPQVQFKFEKTDGTLQSLSRYKSHVGVPFCQNISFYIPFGSSVLTLIANFLVGGNRPSYISELQCHWYQWQWLFIKHWVNSYDSRSFCLFEKFWVPCLQLLQKSHRILYTTTILEQKIIKDRFWSWTYHHIILKAQMREVM